MSRSGINTTPRLKDPTIVERTGWLRVWETMLNMTIQEVSTSVADCHLRASAPILTTAGLVWKTKMKSGAKISWRTAITPITSATDQTVIS